MDYKAIDDFRNRALNPEHPVVRGTTQNPDIYFQQRESVNAFYEAVPDIVQGYMDSMENITGRKYRLFDYYGAQDAEMVIVAMASVTGTISEVVDYLNARGEKVGMVKVNLYRPFSEKHFHEVLPKTIKRWGCLIEQKNLGQ